MSEQYLFSNGDIFSSVQGQEAAAVEYIRRISSEKILNAPEHDLIQAVVEEFTLRAPVIRDEEIYIADSAETQVDVRDDPTRLVMDRSRPCLVAGTRTVIAVPFSGDPGFFLIRPQQYSLSLPRCQVTANELRFTYTQTSPNAPALKHSYEESVRTIKDHLRSLSESVAQFNRGLERLAATNLKARKDRLLADAGMVASLGLPMKKRAGAPVTYSVPVNRRRPRIEQIRTEQGFRPEPALAKEDYEEILRIMKNMVQVMERSPHEFSEIGEEGLRSHFLVQLNGAFEGQATGETFNFQGKTDILIRVEGKNIFIAECKFWKGEKSFLETLDQLLSYLSWRDSKAAVLVFNRNANFTAVLEKVVVTAPTHKNFKRDLGKSDESTFRYAFSQPTDANREITLTVMAFDIPKAADAAAAKRANIG
jgi:hypothetical protein